VSYVKTTQLFLKITTMGVASGICLEMTGAVALKKLCGVPSEQLDHLIAHGEPAEGHLACVVRKATR
jgi:hypothetical protein